MGAGRTLTNAFTAFTLRIGGLYTPCYAYVLEGASQFRYDLLLGHAWLKKFGATLRWDDDAYELTHPTEKVHFVIKPVKAEEGTSVPKMMKKLACRLRPKHAVPSRVGPLCCTHEAIIASDRESTLANDGSHKALELKESFGQRLKRIVKETIPKVFRDKVGCPPLRKWVHKIDVGNEKPLRKYGRPLTPVEHESIKKFVEDGLEDSVIESSDSAWSSPLLPVPKKDGTSRICVDFQALNKLTKPNAYSLP